MGVKAEHEWQWVNEEDAEFHLGVRQMHLILRYSLVGVLGCYIVITLSILLIKQGLHAMGITKTGCGISGRHNKLCVWIAYTSRTQGSWKQVKTKQMGSEVACFQETYIEAIPFGRGPSRKQCLHLWSPLILKQPVLHRCRHTCTPNSSCSAHLASPIPSYYHACPPLTSYTVTVSLGLSPVT